MSEPPPRESRERPPRHHAEVLISADPASFTDVRRRLDALAGVEVQELDPATGRCVAALECTNRAEGDRLFVALGHLPNVRSVQLVAAPRERRR